MKLRISTLTGVTGLALAIALGATACSSSPRSAATPPPTARTIISYVTVTPSQSAAPPTATQAQPTQAQPTQAPPDQAPAPTAAPPTPVQAPNVTDPWAVVAAYYGDVESGNYAEAYALLSSGLVTGQTYQDFVNGYACTGSQSVSENWESGGEVNFNLTADDMCTGATQYFTGTDTVQGGKIVAADITQAR
jgi:hypothetical protein